MSCHRIPKQTLLSGTEVDPRPAQMMSAGVMGNKEELDRQAGKEKGIPGCELRVSSRSKLFYTKRMPVWNWMLGIQAVRTAMW